MISILRLSPIDKYEYASQGNVIIGTTSTRSVITFSSKHRSIVKNHHENNHTINTKDSLSTDRHNIHVSGPIPTLSLRVDTVPRVKAVHARAPRPRQQQLTRRTTATGHGDQKAGAT